jgi:transposase-like protein
VPKFNKSEREYVKDIVNLYSLKRFSTEEIIRGIYEVTKRKVTPVYISQVRKRIREDAAKWYRSIRDGEYEYIYQRKD